MTRRITKKTRPKKTPAKKNPVKKTRAAHADAAGTGTVDVLKGWIDAQRQAWQAMCDNAAITKSMPEMWQSLSGLGSMQSPLSNPFDLFANLPGLGYAREKQENSARLYKAWRAHEAAQQKYNAQLAGIALAGLAQFEASLLSPQPDDKPLTSLKEVYARWVDISEKLYAQFAASPAHTELYGELVNTLSAFKKEMTSTADQSVAQFNLPTRAEVDSLHQRVHALQRDNRALHALLKKPRRRPS